MRVADERPDVRADAPAAGLADDLAAGLADDLAAGLADDLAAGLADGLADDMAAGTRFAALRVAPDRLPRLTSGLPRFTVPPRSRPA